MIEIPLGGAAGGVTIVDDVDAWAADHRWTLLSTGYAYRRIWRGEGITSPCLLLHRVIAGLEQGDPLTVDHVNRDRLDNRRANLRILTMAENNQNRPAREGSSSFRGVYWHKGSGKWAARGTVDGRMRHLGLFTDELEAAEIAAAWRAQTMPYATF